MATSKTTPATEATETSPEADVAAPAGGEAAKAEVLKTKEFLTRVADVIGNGKRANREVVEATLTVLGAALVKGEAFFLPPLGRGRIAKTDDEGIITLKLRQVGAPKPAGKAAKEPLAPAEE